MASDFWPSSCLNLPHAGITGMCHHAEAMRVSQHLSDPPLPYTPVLWHTQRVPSSTLSPWEPSTKKWDGVFGAGRKATLESCLASSPQAAWPHPTPEFALTSWIYLLAWSQAAPCLSRLPQLQPASLCPIPKLSGRRWEYSRQKWPTA